MTPSCAQCGDVVTSSTAPSLYCCPGCERAALLGSSFFAPQNHYLDDPEFRTGRFGSEARILPMKFYVEGVSCPSCVQTLEGLPSLDVGVHSARFDLGSSVLSVELDANARFAALLAVVERLGYRASPLENLADQDQARKRENRSELIRIAVAAACSANIMLASVSLYAGATGGLAALFRWVTLGLAVPSVFYCAWPFYRNSIAGVRAGRISVDLPVSAAVLIGFVSGLIQALRGSNHIYLDSLTALIFLLLTSRFFLKRLQEKSLSLSEIMNSWLPRSSAQVGQLVSFNSGDLVSVDGYLVDESAWVDTSVVTGESEPRPFHQGELILAGMVNLGNGLSLRVSAVNDDRAIARQLLDLDRLKLERNETIEIADRYAQLFLGAVVLIALGVIAWFWQSSPEVGLSRALTLAVVACPCALALATPLTFVQGYRAALESGFILKNVSVLDRLLEVRKIFFDKTGTLTYGQLKVVRIIESGACPKNWQQVVYALEVRSKHPIARAICAHFDSVTQSIPAIANWCEHPGQGVSGTLGVDEWVVKRETDSPRVGVYLNFEKIAELEMRDRLREESKSVIDQLRAIGLQVGLVSGDHEVTAKEVGAQAGFQESEIFAALSPNEKVLKTKGSMVVGDGLNDAPALASAQVGLAVRGALETNLRVADVVSTREGLSHLPRLFAVAKRVRKVLLVTYAFSGVYNLVGASLAVMGMIGPLGAAVLMPASSLSVFLATLWIRRLAA